MKIKLTNVEDKISKICDACIYFDFSFDKIIKNQSFRIKKKSASSKFSFQNEIILNAFLPLIIFETMFFYFLKNNEILDNKKQNMLHELFDIELKNFKNDLGNKDPKILKHVESHLLKFQKCINQPKNKINDRLIVFNSKSTEHLPCLGDINSKEDNIIIKFRGVPPESIHIRIGIIIKTINKNYEFILQDIVNKGYHNK